MNPSSSLWVKKFGKDFESKTNPILDFKDLYRELTAVGFVYGLHFKTAEEYRTTHLLLADEIAKLNLLYSLSEVHATVTKTRDYNLFLEDVLRFYHPLVKASSFWKNILSKDPSNTLEGLIDKRINNRNNRLTQLFSSNFYNAFVVFDFICFYHFLIDETDFDDSYGYLKELTLLYGKRTQLQIPESKHQLYGILLAHLGADHLFEDYDADSIQTDTYWYHRYLLDFCSIVINAQNEELNPYQNYLHSISVELHLSEKDFALALECSSAFKKAFQVNITSLKNSNTINRFQTKINHLAERLIKRNSKRIIIELKNSKELLLLLSHSTHRELSAEEQKKVQQYALDIAKSIPSIAIFMLPGGALLLPIFIRLIPKLLPSAFDENRIE
jgi:hypothetical protein